MDLIDFTNSGKRQNKVDSTSHIRLGDRDPRCAFCNSRDTALTVEGINICKYHFATITRTAPTGSPISGTKRYRQSHGNLHIVTLGDMGRMVIPEGFYRKLGLKKGDRFAPLMHVTHNFALLFASEDGNIYIDDYNRLILPCNMLDQLEWGERDKIAVVIDVRRKLIKLTLKDKYIPKCVFCNSSNIAMTLQGRDICDFHVEYILQSTKEKEMM